MLTWSLRSTFYSLFCCAKVEICGLFFFSHLYNEAKPFAILIFIKKTYMRLLNLHLLCSLPLYPETQWLWSRWSRAKTCAEILLQNQVRPSFISQLFDFFFILFHKSLFVVNAISCYIWKRNEEDTSSISKLAPSIRKNSLNQSLP